MKNFFSTSFNIYNKKIGLNLPTFIIAEAGVNHNGSLKNAFKLVDVAKKAGADAVKFQTFDTETSTVKSLKKAEYQKKNKKDKETQYEMLKRLELSYEDHVKINNYCKKKKIIFFSTPSDLKSVNLLKKINVPCYKISSVDLNNYELIKEICKTKKPLIISTGMSNLEDVKETKKKLLNFKNNKIIFLHCISSYPTKDKDLNLNSIKLLKNNIKSLVGFSDHSLGYFGPILSVACGACVIEKHITLNKKMEGPDHKISMNPSEFRLMIKKVREAELTLGKNIKKINSSELNTLSVTKKIFIAKKKIIKGQKLKQNMLIIKSGGKGLNYKEIKPFLGKKLIKTIAKDISIKRNHFK